MLTAATRLVCHPRPLAPATTTPHHTTPILSMERSFKPDSPAFAELWLDGEKVSALEYWKKDMLEGSTGKNHIPPVGV